MVILSAPPAGISIRLSGEFKIELEHVSGRFFATFLLESSILTPSKQLRPQKLRPPGMKKNSGKCMTFFTSIKIR